MDQACCNLPLNPSPPRLHNGTRLTKMTSVAVAKLQRGGANCLYNNTNRNFKRPQAPYQAKDRRAGQWRPTAPASKGNLMQQQQILPRSLGGPSIVPCQLSRHMKARTNMQQMGSVLRIACTNCGRSTSKYSSACSTADKKPFSSVVRRI